jgi:hypothetical protein
MRKRQGKKNLKMFIDYLEGIRDCVEVDRASFAWIEELLLCANDKYYQVDR